MKTVIVIIFYLLSGAFQPLCHASSTDFKSLNEQKCTALKQEDTARLPAVYHPYRDFIKICTLQKNDHDKPWTTALVSIWAHDFLRAKGETTQWENFPPSILIDEKFRVIGNLPEIYPMDWATHLNVTYGKWHRSRPEEVRVDVSNPAASGDYYYAPLRWDRAKGRYETTSEEAITGKRP